MFFVSLVLLILNPGTVTVYHLDFCKIEVRHTFEKKKSCLSIFSLKKSYA